MRSLIDALAQRATQHPERIALVFGEQRIRYGELWGRVLAAARHLLDCGLLPGERVLLAAPSVPAFVYGYFATHLIGAVAVAIDPRAPATRRDELIRRTAPKLAFGANAEPHPVLGRIHAIAEIDNLPLHEMSYRAPPLDSLADLLFTTGTTGKPKGVRLTHCNLAAAIQHINEVIGTRDGDVEVVPLPLYHSFGLGRLRCCMVAGATVVLVDGFRLPGEILTALDRHAATGLVGVPAGFAVLLRLGDRGLGPFAERLRYVEIGSAPMPISHKQSLMKLLPHTSLFMHYGLTEASRSAFIEFHRDSGRLDTVGAPAPGVRVQIRDESDRTCDPGVRGMLWIAGQHVSPGYWDDAVLGAQSFADGWVRTGDVAHIDEAGYIHLHGRHDDLINVGGAKVAPDEVERVLEDHPGVAEAACLGMPDPRGIAGQVLLAFLVAPAEQAPVPDAELSGWVAQRLESYKVPTQYRWVAALPRTASGKLIRVALRDRVISEL